MAINRKCPKCGSDKVQLSNEMNKHGCLYMILFGWWYFAVLIFKWIIGLMILMLYDWWMAIIKAVMRKGHVWQCKKWFSNKKQVYYCHDCGHNFRA